MTDTEAECTLYSPSATTTTSSNVHCNEALLRAWSVVVCPIHQRKRLLQFLPLHSINAGHERQTFGFCGGGSGCFCAILGCIRALGRRCIRSSEVPCAHACRSYGWLDAPAGLGA